MIRKRLLPLAIIVLVSIALGACDLLPTQETATQLPDQDLLATAAAQTVAAELTAQPTATSATSTPTLAVVTDTPELVSPSPEPTETQIPTPVSYTNEEYGFSFDHLSSWDVQGVPHSLQLSKGELNLIVGYRFPEESVSITGTGTPAGDFETRGQISFLGREIDRVALVYESKVKALYYDGANEEITVFDAEQTPQLVFSISLQVEDVEVNFEDVDIPEAAQSEVDAILESFSVTFEQEGVCTDQAEFVEDVTIPDDTIVAAGDTFEKTWRLRNTGTCTWTTEYQIVFDNGDQMDAESLAPLPQEVDPEETVDISVELTAPGAEGTYRGDWKLQNADGQVFGVGEDSDLTFWVQVVVEITETTDDLNLGNADWRDNLNDASYWFLLDTEDTLWDVEDGQLIMTSFNPGSGDRWGLSTQPALADFYLEAVFITGETCSGLDRYGVLTRSPEPNSGYVFGFSCDGRYRIYKWDGENEIYTALREWTSASSIRQGPDQTNRLGFFAQGTTLKLYANGNLLEELTDSTYDEGRFGLFIGSTNTQDLQVMVDEIAYWLLE
ncbi:MAG: NBR1-Ig-like domain-containing protein [Anaerolineales bacterium]